MNRALLKSILSFPLALSPVSVAALTAIMLPSTAEAAEGGSIRGIVSDAETGEPVSDAIIIVQCNCLESPRETRPNAAGVYALYDLPPGRYTVQVLAGKQSTSKVVTLEREQSTNMNFSVTPSKPEVIEVEVDAAPVQQDTASGISVKMKEVQNVPVGGSASRDFTDVVLMSPTAEKTAGGISLGGTTAAESKYTLDGASVNNPSAGTVGVQVVQEFIASVEVQEAGYDAEFGGASGGQVNARRVSGSNEIRGTARLTVTPRIADPRLVTATDEALRTTQIRDVQGQAVFLVRGPIIKDRLFFVAYVGPEASRYSLIQNFYVRVDRDMSGGFADCPYENGQNDCADGASYIETRAFGAPKQYKTGSIAGGWAFGLDWSITTQHKLSFTIRGGPSFSRLSYRLPISGQGGANAFGGGSASLGAGQTSIATGIVDKHFGWSKYNDVSTSLRYEGRAFRDRMEIDALVSYYRSASEDAFKLDNPNIADMVMTQEQDIQGRNLYEFLDRDNAVDSVDGVEDACNDSDLPGLPCRITRWLSGGLGQYGSDASERAQAVAKFSHFFDFAGRHQVKYGGEFEWLRRRTSARWSGKNDSDFYENCAELGYEGGGEWCYDPSTGQYLNGSEVTANRVNNHRFVVVDSDNPEDRTSIGFGRVRRENNDLRAITDALARGARVDEYNEQTSTLNYALFLQDRWSILSNLFVGAGVRWSAQDMRDIFGRRQILIRDAVAPRVSMFYDWTDEGRSRLYASYGWFYNPLPLQLNSRVFGGNVVVRRSYRQSDCEDQTTTVTNKDGEDVTHQRLVDGQPTEWCMDYAQIGGTTGTTLGAVVPRLRGQFNKQFQIGYQQEIIEDLTMGFRWLHTDLGRAVEDVSTDGGTNFIIANPGVAVSDSEIAAEDAECERLEAEYEDAESDMPGADENRPLLRELTQCRFRAEAFRRVNRQFDKPSRNYDAWTFDIRKSFGNNWLAVASYTYSRLVGNYDGFVDPTTGAVNLGASTQYDLPELVRNSYGPLSGNIPHRVNLDAFYTFDLRLAGKITLGTSARFRSGAPISLRARNARYTDGFQTFVLPRGAGGRVKPWYEVNLSLTYAYALPKDITLQFAARLINVTNADAILAVDNVYSFSTTRAIAGGQPEDLLHARAQTGSSQTEFFGENIITRQGNYGVEQSFQQPMTAQFDLRLDF